MKKPKTKFQKYIVNNESLIALIKEAQNLTDMSHIRMMNHSRIVDNIAINTAFEERRLELGGKGPMPVEPHVAEFFADNLFD